MMMMPRVINRGTMDDFFNGFFRESGLGDRSRHMSGLMKTDIKDCESGYELNIDMPGVKKEDVKAQIKDGYLTISAVANSENEEKDEEGKFIYRERYTGSMNRSFYVGDHLSEDDVKAKFEEGILKICIPKEHEKAIEEEKFIAIEG